MSLANVHVKKHLRKKLIERFQRRFSKKLSIAAMIPNMTTLMALCSGLSSVRFALIERWDLCIFAILLAAFLDAMDGRLARLLNSSSRMGVELDSLADLINFGAAPAIVMYLFILNQWGAYGWSISLFYTCCMALRLARFNTLALDDEEKPAWQQGFFVGVPAPAAAFLALFPLALDLHFEAFSKNGTSAFFIGLWMLIIGALKVSPLPTFSIKRLHIKRKAILPLFLGFALFVSLTLSAPWIAYCLMGIVYVATFPLSYKRFKKLTHAYCEKNEDLKDMPSKA